MPEQISSLGHLLSSTRKKRKVQLQEISAKLKIQLPQLQALENDDYSVFSSTALAKGFLLRYAGELGLEQERVLALFRREQALQAKSRFEFREAGEKVSRLLFSRRGLSFMLGTIVSLFFMVYFGFQLYSLFQPPKLVLTEPWDVAEEGTYTFSTVEPTLKFAGFTEQQTLVDFNGQVLKLSPEFEFETLELPLSQEVNIFSFTATSVVGRDTNIVLEVIVEEKVEANTI